jgi:hypothetical protein
MNFLKKLILVALAAMPIAAISFSAKQALAQGTHEQVNASGDGSHESSGPSHG